jgi:hypothetical protein
LKKAEPGSIAELASEPLSAQDVGDAVNYRLAVTDLFVEKAQFHLERRADRYEWLGFIMYGLAVAIFVIGAFIAVSRMLQHDKTPPLAAAAPAKPAAATSAQPTVAAPAQPAVVDNTQRWIDLLLRFILAFTGYGFIVLTAVALARGARACLDQRERLLAKRHSLRQGRLYLHLTGGHVTIEEMERAFNWNHEQHNAFTHMPTDTKAPWGTVVGEIVKITPELVKAGVALAKESAEKEKKNRKEEGKAAG